MTQDFIVYILVALAALYLVRMVWSSTKGKGGCNSCGTGGGCEKPKTPDALIQISLSPPDKK